VKKLLVLLVVLLIFAFLGVSFLGGALLKKGVEAGGTFALQTDVTLRSASLSLAGVSASLAGLRVANPKGFQSEKAIEVGQVAVAAGITRLLGDPVVIDRIEVTQPDVTLEVGTSGTNLGVLLASAGRFAGGEAPKDGPKEAGKKLRVGLVSITGAKVRLAATPLGGAGAQATLPDLTLRDVGTGGDGATIGQLLEAMLAEIVRAAAKTTGAFPDQVLRSLADEAKRSAVQAVDAALKKGVAGATKEIEKGVEGATKEITKGIDGILKPKK
jgi:hypothetical protein